jgi:hypothetical protein
MRTLSYAVMTAALILALSAPEVWAQDQAQQQSQGPTQPPSQAEQPAQPIQAYHAPLGGLGDNSQGDTDESGEALAPDTRSLVGAQYLSLGAPKTGHSFWMPYFDLSSTLDSNAFSGSGGTGWSTWTTVYGGLDFHRISGNSSLVLSYVGGEAFSNESGIGNSTIQQFGVAEQLTLHRSVVTFLDQLAYLPESAFGYAGIGGADLQSGGNVGLQSSFMTNQSILTGIGQRISNSFVTQADTFLTPRSRITLVGSYGTLDFFGSDLNNNREVTVQGGYNYVLSRKDTIAVLYRFDAFRYDHIAQSINDNSVQLSYARRVTGRLALQLSGGPDVAFSETPITGTSSASTGTTGSSMDSGKTTQFFWDLASSVSYNVRRTTLGMSYNHGVTGGSGVLAGAITDNVSSSANRELTRNTTGSLSLGYARNQGLAITPLSATATSETFDYWFTGLNLTHRLGRSMNLSLGYQANYQNSNTAFCITASCGPSYLENEIFMTIGWHPRPTTF